jgi:hypothetical protein
MSKKYRDFEGKDDVTTQGTTERQISALKEPDPVKKRQEMEANNIIDEVN